MPRSGGCESSPGCVLSRRNSAAIPAPCVLAMLGSRSPESGRHWWTGHRPGAGSPRSGPGHRFQSMVAGTRTEDEKRIAAEAAAELVADGMVVGLGTGSTVAHLLPALAGRELSIRCVATSPRTESHARELDIPVEPFEALDRLDIAIDGADQVTPDGWLVKGGG